MPKPIAGETRADYLSRCIPAVIEDGAAEDADQAAAICASMWDERDKANAPQIEHKTFPAEIVNIDEERGIVDAIVAVFGNTDDGRDVLHPGAFAKTISERFDRVRVLDAHNSRSVLNIVGVPMAAREVSRAELPEKVLEKAPNATGGLWTQTRYLINTPEGRGVFERIKERAVTEYSFGYDAIVADPSMGEDGRPVRNLREVRLWEYSPVVWGMNPATATTSVKRAELEAEIDELLARVAEMEEKLSAPGDEPGRDESGEDATQAGPVDEPPTCSDKAPDLDERRAALLEQIRLQGGI